MSSFIAFHLTFLIQSFSLNIDWLAGKPRPPCFPAFPALDYGACGHDLCFHMLAGNPNSGLYDCVVSDLPTNVSPQPFELLRGSFSLHFFEIYLSFMAHYIIS